MWRHIKQNTANYVTCPQCALELSHHSDGIAKEDSNQQIYHCSKCDLIFSVGCYYQDNKYNPIVYIENNEVMFDNGRKIMSLKGYDKSCLCSRKDCSTGLNKELRH